MLAKPQVKMLAVAVLTIFSWLVVTYLTPPEPEATLDRFYAKVRPGGPGWKPVAARNPGRQGRQKSEVVDHRRPVCDGYRIFDVASDRQPDIRAYLGCDQLRYDCDIVCDRRCNFGPPTATRLKFRLNAAGWAGRVEQILLSQY